MLAVPVSFTWKQRSHALKPVNSRHRNRSDAASFGKQLGIIIQGKLSCQHSSRAQRFECYSWRDRPTGWTHLYLCFRYYPHSLRRVAGYNNTRQLATSLISLVECFCSSNFGLSLSKNSVIAGLNPHSGVNSTAGTRRTRVVDSLVRGKSAAYALSCSQMVPIPPDTMAAASSLVSVRLFYPSPRCHSAPLSRPQGLIFAKQLLTGLLTPPLVFPSSALHRDHMGRFLDIARQASLMLPA